MKIYIVAYMRVGQPLPKGGCRHANFFEAKTI